MSFELVAVNLDQKQPGFPEHVLPAYLDRPRRAVPDRRPRTPIRSSRASSSPGKTMCGLCSRLRRGILYRIADEVGATKVALGHHRDDIVETLFLNMFYGARLKAMPPKLKSDDGKHIVIRPLAYCPERDIARYARGREFPIIPCNLCGSQDNMKRRDDRRRCSRAGSSRTRVEPSACSAACRTSRRRISPIATLFDFESLSGRGDRTQVAERAEAIAAQPAASTTCHPRAGGERPRRRRRISSIASMRLARASESLRRRLSRAACSAAVGTLRELAREQRQRCVAVLVEDLRPSSRPRRVSRPSASG